MKRLVMPLAAGLVASVAFLAGCASPGVHIQIPTPQQLATDVCPAVNAGLKALDGSPLLTADQQANLTKKIIPGNEAVCAAGAQLDLADLQAFSATVFPAVIALVSGLPGIPNQQAILFGLQIAQPLLKQIVGSVIPLSAPVPASAAVVASAPQGSAVGL
ncbi:hypothetical protein AB3X91_09160 [Paraburkholderia sp. BR14263]|uniref:hypothetical protein n=1 Tax=unclassified Paraburkholderia TaxID=2615204 RepID=UPI0034CF14CF